MKHQIVKGNQMWRFWVLSSIGVICFFVPFQINGVQTIIVDHVHLAIRAKPQKCDALYCSNHDFNWRNFTNLS